MNPLNSRPGRQRSGGLQADDPTEIPAGQNIADSTNLSPNESPAPSNGAPPNGAPSNGLSSNGSLASGQQTSAPRPSSTHSVNERAASPNQRSPAAHHDLRWSRWIVQRALHKLGNPPIAVSFWNGQEVCTSAEPPTSRLRFHDRMALWRVALDPRMQFGEMYSCGRLDVEGDIAEMMISVDRALMRIGRTDVGANGPLHWLRRLLYPNTAAQAKRDIHRHYDLGNDFYRLWLDEQMLYTCAYFAEPGISLEQAQSAKMDHVARKLWLQPGETVIEAGCGWGALALHLARRYGVTVRAFNTSHEQIIFARARARAEGLHDRVEFVEDDWRNIRGCCDAFVSVGMLEHVRPPNYRRLGEVIHGCLKAGGRGLIHSIGRNRPQPMDPWIDRHIFPGAIPPSIGQMMTIFESRDFSLLDAENLRLHYAQTLRHWLARFEQSKDKVLRMFDDRFVRMWRAYLAGSLAAFEAGGLQLFQIVFAPGTNHQVPSTRRYQYESTKPPAPSWFSDQAAEPRDQGIAEPRDHGTAAQRENRHAESPNNGHDQNGHAPRNSLWNAATS